MIEENEIKPFSDDFSNDLALVGSQGGREGKSLANEWIYQIEMAVDYSLKANKEWEKLKAMIDLTSEHTQEEIDAIEHLNGNAEFLSEHADEYFEYAEDTAAEIKAMAKAMRN